MAVERRQKSPENIKPGTVQAPLEPDRRSKLPLLSSADGRRKKESGLVVPDIDNVYEGRFLCVRGGFSLQIQLMDDVKLQPTSSATFQNTQTKQLMDEGGSLSPNRFIIPPTRSPRLAAVCL